MSTTTTLAMSAAALFLALTGASTAADVPVAPGQSVQAAIQAAADGDRILVQPGTYAEAIDFLGKDVEVIGVGGMAVTTLDATGLNDSVVTFANGEPSTALLRGFTITGGTGSQAPGTVSLGGGGIYASHGAQPTIRECRVIANSTSQGGVGAGVLAEWLGANPAGPVIIEDSVIAENVGRGAAGHLVLRRCTIADNVDGGVLGGPVTMRDCLVVGNITPGDGGGLLMLDAEEVDLTGCVFRENLANGMGGGVAVRCQGMVKTLVTRASFVANGAGIGGGGLAVQIQGDSADEIRCEIRSVAFAHNDGNGTGDGVLLLTHNATGPTYAGVFHCSLHENGSDGIESRADTLLLAFSLAWEQKLPVLDDEETKLEHFVWKDGFIEWVPPLYVDAVAGDLRQLATSPWVDSLDLYQQGHDIDFDLEGDQQYGLADHGADEFLPHLRVLGEPRAGATVDLTIIGFPGSKPVAVFAGLEIVEPRAPSDHPFITDFQLGSLLPVVLVLPVMPPSGVHRIPVSLPPSIPAMSLHLQAYVGEDFLPLPFPATFTNVESLRIY